MSDTRMRFLPADVYDALELSALAYGGIGAGQYTTKRGQWGNESDAIPWCILGHAHAADRPHGPISAALGVIGVTPRTSDVAVAGISEGTRVLFEDWCKELNVVRGSVTPPKSILSAATKGGME